MHKKHKVIARYLVMIQCAFGEIPENGSTFREIYTGVVDAFNRIPILDRDSVCHITSLKIAEEAKSVVFDDSTLTPDDMDIILNYVVEYKNEASQLIKVRQAEDIRSIGKDEYIRRLRAMSVEAGIPESEFREYIKDEFQEH